jgi:cytochrome c-type biogenesis protein CcmH
MKKQIALFTLWLLLLAVFTAGSALAQQDPGRPVSDDEVNAVAKQLYCPVCENIPLDVCPTLACQEWRELIRLKLSEGFTPDQVKAYFADQYGDRVLAAPPARGLNWLVYILPPLAILAGVYILYRVFHSWRKPASVPTTIPPTAPSEDEYINRLEEELKNR